MSVQKFSPSDFAHTVWKDQRGILHSIYDIRLYKEPGVTAANSAAKVEYYVGDLYKRRYTSNDALPPNQVWFTVNKATSSGDSDEIGRIDFVFENFPTQQFPAVYKEISHTDIAASSTQATEALTGKQAIEKVLFEMDTSSTTKTKFKSTDSATTSVGARFFDHVLALLLPC